MDLHRIVGFGLTSVATVTLGVIDPAVALPQAPEFDAAIYRARLDSNVTAVDGVLEFDRRMAELGEDCGYVVGVKVTDSARTPILNDRWQGAAACGLAAGAWGRAGTIVETFRFAVMPGRYTVEVSVEPAGKPEAARTETFELYGLSSDDLVSDPILAREIAWRDSSDGRWTLSKGDLGIAAAPNVVADPSRPKLSYYMEVYPWMEEPVEGRALGIIRRADGFELARMEIEEFELAGEARPLAGTLSLAGLPPGKYELGLRVELPDTVLERSSPFRMAASRPTGLEEDREGYFWQLSADELSELFAPVVVWMQSDRQRRFYRSLSADGKRRFLTQFFAEEPSERVTGSADSESNLDTYLERVRHVQATYSEKAGLEGWQTDRGRIYLLRGKPDDRLERPFPQQNSPPYEIWSYDLGRTYVYLFVDETRFGHYRLVYSTDPDQASLPDWARRAGNGALDDLGRFFAGRPRF